MHTHTALLALRHFAHEHDDLPAFHAGYLVLTVVFAALLNLGAFALLIAVHVALDLVKYREVHSLSWARTLEGTFRESLLDLLLLSVALTFSVYLHHTIGIVAASGIVRADLTLARFAGVFLPKFEILHRFLVVLLRIGEHLRTIHIRIGQGFSAAEKLQIFLIVSTLILLLAAPTILLVSTGDLVLTVVREMIPWRL
ncbi:MAG TPA: hypothetical protein DEB30_01930 [Candidatus Peribacter riflensis]|uniref:Uncharacterized protein n=1 Tax=Candidatus Peribacter riflensis TaxID=1735162 RepID=A0A0S1SI54_9BACT|nr:MAG: hypothetical protein PeribacterA2_0477 [Candidatus Peribacter riflensis]OGJ82475.1 MAG: hypothetical protein A2412_03210 [Candidatus Peribacteria bacterium RIFOXYC1_FULL_58_8]ALM10962.1 MAG: hypothetical protein PeribacterB2_0476 [Candidatus Peribacter riflensis]ALM12065.1 MAG: hypothetical protein PeribacterC2_0476 [Candidatus Peribacter riflensis]ALM13168.1 MAG: hypothetical protein PeribacterD1_0477 [Candidatus Peribacter riflensis]